MAEKTVRVRLEALTAQYQAAMTQATASTAKLGIAASKNAAQVRQGFSTIGIAAVAMGGAMLFGLSKAADAAVEFESNLTRMRTLVGLTTEETDEMGAVMLRLGDTGVGPLALSDALFFITSAGQRGAQALDTLEIAAKASAIGLGETKTIADAATSAMNAYGAENLSAATATDILAGAVREGKLEASSISPVLGNLVGIASALGIGFEDVAGTMAVLSRVGIEAATGATQISAVMTALVSDSPKVATALGSVGLEMEDLRTVASEEGLIGVMRTLDEAFGSNVEAMRAVFPNVRAFRAVMAALAQDSGVVDEVLMNVAESGGIVGEGFEEWSKSAEGARARFSAAAEGMAVSLGGVLLPAMSFVLERGTEFFSFIRDLPGPVRVVAVALMAASAAMLVLAGSTLFLAPRIAMTKVALAEMGITAGVAGGRVGIFRGSLALAARALNPLTLGIGAAVVGIGFFVSAHQEAKQRVEDFTEAIKADSGALGENTRQVAINELQKADLFKEAKKFGIDQAVLTDAVLGEADALHEVAGALAEYREAQGGAAVAGKAGEAALLDEEGAARHLESALGILNGTVSEAEVAAADEAAAMEGSAEANEEAAGAAGAHGDALADELNPELEETVDLAQELSGALEELAGRQLDARKAAIAWHGGLADLRKELKEGAKTLDINTEAGRENQDALIRQIDLALDHGAAVAEESGSLEKGVRVTQEHIRALIDEATKAGFSEKAIRGYIRELNLTPKQIRTALELVGIEKATGQLDAFKAKIDGIPDVKDVLIRFQSTGGGRAQQIGHGGGIVGQLPRYHDGVLGLRSDEVPLIARRGEYILTPQQYASLRAAPAASGNGAAAVAAPSMPLVHNTIVVKVGDREMGRIVVDALSGQLVRG